MPNLPPLYKYLDVQGAKLTLRNRNFKHAKPSDFNDTEELTIRSIFPESDEAAVAEMENNFTDILLRNLNEPPTGGTEAIRQKIAVLQDNYRNNPGAAKAVREAKQRVSSIFDIDQVTKNNQAFIKEINEFMQGYRILCVSELKDSERMWMRYAQDHEGIVLRIVPNLKKDSKYQLFRKVEYREARPPLYESALSFLERSMFGDQDKNRKATLDQIVYTKTREWEYEKEYRLSIPVIGQDWNVMPYHPKEITELYLGLKMTDETKIEMIDLAEAVNPKISVFETYLDGNGKLSFRK